MRARLAPALAARRARPPAELQTGDYLAMNYGGEGFQLRMGSHVGVTSRGRPGKITLARQLLWNWLLIAKDLNMHKLHAAELTPRRMWAPRGEEEQLALLLAAEALRAFPDAELRPQSLQFVAGEVAEALVCLGRRRGTPFLFSAHRLALMQIGELCRGKTVLFVFPTDADVRLAFEVMGAKPVQLPCAQPGAELDWAALEAAVETFAPAALFLASPAPPLGTPLAAGELQRLGQLCLQRGLTLVADESDKDGTFPWQGFTSVAATGLGLDALQMVVLDQSLQFFFVDAVSAPCVVTLHGFDAATEREMGLRAALHRPSIAGAMYLLAQCRWLRRTEEMSELFPRALELYASRLTSFRLLMYLRQMSAHKRLSDLPGLRVFAPQSCFHLLLEFEQAAERLGGGEAVDARLCELLRDELQLLAVPGSQLGLPAARGFVLLSTAHTSQAYIEQLVTRLERFTASIATRDPPTAR